MAWLGKLVGGAVGFVLGGPVGAFAGATFGHAFDLQDGELEGGGHERIFLGIESRRLQFLVPVFSMLADVARADGKVTEDEIHTVRDFMNQHLVLTPAETKAAMQIFGAALKSPEPFQAFADRFYRQSGERPEMLLLLMEAMVRVAAGDGGMHPEQEKLILSAVDLFHLDPKTYQQIKTMHVRVDEKYYAVLGCRADDSNDHIRHQYRKLVFDYHPDRIAAKDLPEAMVAFSEKKFRDVQDAYDAIRKIRGF